MSYCRSTLLVGFSLGFVFSLAFAQASHDAASNAQLASPEIEQKVDTLLKRMTFDEKIGQLVQYSATEAHPAKLSGPSTAALNVNPPGPGGIDSYALAQKGELGSMLNTVGQGLTNHFQHAAVDNTRLHILHISTAKETELFDNTKPLKEKRITAEACIHHLWFSDEEYKTKGSLIKWNPAVKTAADRDAVLKAVLDNRIDIIATDHAPHTLEEKNNSYFKTPSGGPMVQHSLVAMLELYHRKKISLEKVVEKMCHAPADCFRVEKRGYVRKGYYADLVLVDMNTSWLVEKSNLLYKCGWSPFEGQTFHSIKGCRCRCIQN